MLLDLIKIFGPVIHSTLSANLGVGVNIQAEQRYANSLQNLYLAQKYLDVKRAIVPVPTYQRETAVLNQTMQFTNFAYLMQVATLHTLL